MPNLTACPPSGSSTYTSILSPLCPALYLGSRFSPPRGPASSQIIFPMGTTAAVSRGRPRAQRLAMTTRATDVEAKTSGQKAVPWAKERAGKRVGKRRRCSLLAESSWMGCSPASVRCDHRGNYHTSMRPCPSARGE